MLAAHCAAVKKIDIFCVRKRWDCGTVSARSRESKAQWPTFEQPVSVGERVHVFSSVSVYARAWRLSMCVNTSAAKIFPPSVVWSVCHAVVFGFLPVSLITSSAVGIEAKFVSFTHSVDQKLCFWRLLFCLTSMSVVVAWQLQARRQLNLKGKKLSSV